MRKLFIFIILAAILSAFQSDNDLFVGKILYKNSFTDLKGNDITEKMAFYIPLELHYYIDGKNYKASDPQNNLLQLYSSLDNIYYHFSKDKTAQKIDASTQTSKKIVVTRLDIKEEIAGYDCSAIQIETDNETTIYFYNASLKADVKAFSKHNFGVWNKYLEATDGALPLKHVIIDQKSAYIWTSMASEVNRMSLTAKDFEFPAGFTLKY